MNQNSGSSRTSVHRNHALICPDSHVPLHFPQWPGCEVVILISPEMGAKFTQSMVAMQAGASLAPRRVNEEWFVLVLSGGFTASGTDIDVTCSADEYSYLPPGDWHLEAEGETQLLTFSKAYVPDAQQPPPAAFSKALDDVPGEPFLGDPAANLQVLLPDAPAYDWGINLFEFQPGGTLPQVESHFMEHGLYLLAGEGVYRLGDHWYPVQAGDTIWMGPYLPQWYAATGKTPSRYIYYKEMNRAPIASG